GVVPMRVVYTPTRTAVPYLRVLFIRPPVGHAWHDEALPAATTAPFLLGSSCLSTGHRYNDASLLVVFFIKTYFNALKRITWVYRQNGYSY
ncbi:hypothetical protein, partial [Aliidiomarina quisquiliarum]|uniref:hypothetical protein n=1 Tax=Aliidiomarina quisquiliarum TaxID=2938947 RepID=UPI00208E501D